MPDTPRDEAAASQRTTTSFRVQDHLADLPSLLSAYLNSIRLH